MINNEMMKHHVEHLMNVARARYKAMKKELDRLDNPPTEKQFIAVYLIAHKDVMDIMALTLEGKRVIV